jgi:hypothetical protein
MGGFAAENQKDLTAPEYAVLMAGKRVVPSVVMRAAFVETLARGAVRLETHGVSNLGRVRDQRLIVAAEGPVDDLGPVLRPVLDTVRTARATDAVDGAVGVTVPSWAQRFKTTVGLSRYVSDVVQPALAARGLSTRRPKTFLPGSHDRLTSDGEQLAASARKQVAAARAQVDKAARKAWAKDPALAAATLSGLGSLGTLVLADPQLVAALVELRGLAPGAGLPPGGTAAGAAAMVPLWATGGGIDGAGFDGSGFDGLDTSSFGGLDTSSFDGLDASDLSSFDSGFGGGFDGGGFDGGGFGGGFDGGSFGGGDGGGSSF